MQERITYNNQFHAHTETHPSQSYSVQETISS